jgi:hypothetical protein
MDSNPRHQQQKLTALPLSTHVWHSLLHHLRLHAADVEAVDWTRMSALMVAAAWANHETLSELLTSGADPNERCHDTCDWGTPLNAAIAWSRGQPSDVMRIVKTLLAAGAVPDEQTMEHAREVVEEGPHEPWDVALLGLLLEEHAQYSGHDIM